VRTVDIRGLGWRRPKPAPKQRFVASHYREEDFKGGLRRYAKYRDLGMAAASDKRQWGMESAKAGSARDSTVAAGCRFWRRSAR
jgi:hypothetical protein